MNNIFDCFNSSSDIIHPNKKHKCKCEKEEYHNKKYKLIYCKDCDKLEFCDIEQDKNFKIKISFLYQVKEVFGYSNYKILKKLFFHQFKDDATTINFQSMYERFDDILKGMLKK